MKKYLRIYLFFIRESLIKTMEYRFNFISGLISNFCWSNFSLVSILILNSITGGFGGWNTNQMLLLTGCWMINNSVAYFAFYGNIKELISDINKGNLDFYLSKPVDSQFFVSLRRSLISAVPGFIEGIIIINVALSRLGNNLTITNVVLSLMVFISSWLIYYGLWFISATLSIHFGMTDNLFYVIPELAEASKYPKDSFSPVLGNILTSLIPILTMTIFPAQALMGIITPSFIFYSMVIGTTVFSLSRIFWIWSLNKYTSASS